MMSNAEILIEARRGMSYIEMITFLNYLIGVLAYKVPTEMWAESVEDAKNLIYADRGGK